MHHARLYETRSEHPGFHAPPNTLVTGEMSLVRETLSILALA